MSQFSNRSYQPSCRALLLIRAVIVWSHVILMAPCCASVQCPGRMSHSVLYCILSPNSMAPYCAGVQVLCGAVQGGASWGEGGGMCMHGRASREGEGRNHSGLKRWERVWPATLDLEEEGMSGQFHTVSMPTCQPGLKLPWPLGKKSGMHL